MGLWCWRQQVLRDWALEDRISQYFEPEEIIPAAGQGILGCSGRQDEGYGYLSGYDNLALPL